MRRRLRRLRTGRTPSRALRAVRAELAHACGLLRGLDCRTGAGGLQHNRGGIKLAVLGLHEGVRHFTGALKTVFRILFQRLHHHRHHGGRRFRRKIGDGRGRVLYMLHGHGHRRVPHEGHAAGEHFVQDHAGGIDIAGGFHHAAGGLFGRGIMHRSHHRIALADGEGIGHARNAEIRYFHMAVGVDEHILGLDIAVNDTVVMRMLKGAENADGDLDRGLIVQAALLADDIL